jgi:hypothetical protein
MTRGNARFLIIAFATASLFTPVGITQSQNRDVAKDAKEAAAKLQPSTYYWTDGVWRPMERINMSGGGAKHMGKMLVPGLTPQFVYTYRGPSAPVQVKEDKPLFCVKFIAVPPGTPYAPSPRDSRGEVRRRPAVTNGQRCSSKTIGGNS